MTTRIYSVKANTVNKLVTWNITDATPVIVFVCLFVFLIVFQYTVNAGHGKLLTPFRINI